MFRIPLPALSKSTGAELVQRFFDAMLSGLGLIILSPVLICLAAWIVLDSRGPVFYRAKRVGRYGSPFELYKFRSMVINADRQGPGITVAQDRRVTRAGRFLRRTKLDELPQLINVLNGDMSLVGPRPEDPRYVALYNDQQRQIFNVRPGITSAASLAYRHEEDLLTGVDLGSAVCHPNYAGEAGDRSGIRTQSDIMVRYTVNPAHCGCDGKLIYEDRYQHDGPACLWCQICRVGRPTRFSRSGRRQCL